MFPKGVCWVSDRGASVEDFHRALPALKKADPETWQGEMFCIETRRTYLGSPLNSKLRSLRI